MSWGCLAGILLFPFIAIVVGIGKLIQYIAQGGAPRDIRCPACGQPGQIPPRTQDLNCPRCGTPILRGGQFVAAMRYQPPQYPQQ